MARIRPKSHRDLALVPGIGERKREAYGDAFLAVIREWAKEMADVSRADR
jgi:ATP-dependent DNA helicase RecQ